VFDWFLSTHRQCVKVGGKVDLGFGLFLRRSTGLVVKLTVWSAKLVYSLGLS
jgi:hypothetical protein